MKGVTSVIVTVLLLGVAIGLAGVYSEWAPDLSEEVTLSATNQAEQDTKCRNAGLSIQNPQYDKNTDLFSFEMKNTGYIDLDEQIAVAAFSDAQRMNSTTLSGISPGRSRPVSMKTPGEPERVLVNSGDCPGLRTPLTEVEVTQ